MQPLDTPRTHPAQDEAGELLAGRLPRAVEALFDELPGDGAVVVPPFVLPSAAPAAVDRFDRVSMAFHWGSGLLVLSMFATGWARGFASTAATALLVLTIHRSTGAALWLLSFARAIWQATRAHRPPLPASLPGHQRFAARANEWMLYGMLLVQPLTGLALTVCIGKPFVLFGGHLPRLMERDQAWLLRFEFLHDFGALAMAGLVGMHAMAALYHHVIRRDDVLRTMLPRTRRRPD